jgi:hypothetical protein
MRKNNVPGWGALLCTLTADFFKDWDAILLQNPKLAAKALMAIGGKWRSPGVPCCGRDFFMSVAIFQLN